MRSQRPPGLEILIDRPPTKILERSSFRPDSSTPAGRFPKWTPSILEAKTFYYTAAIFFTIQSPAKIILWGVYIWTATAPCVDACSISFPLNLCTFSITGRSSVAHAQRAPHRSPYLFEIDSFTTSPLKALKTSARLFTESNTNTVEIVASASRV